MSTLFFSVNKVRPIRKNQNKKSPASGGGFCSAVALSMASAARKRGWKGTGAAGGAVAIAEATADLLRSRSSEAGGRAKLSAVTVAPNGFINFEAEVGPSSTLVSTHGPDDGWACVHLCGYVECGAFFFTVGEAANGEVYCQYLCKHRQTKVKSSNARNSQSKDQPIPPRSAVIGPFRMATAPTFSLLDSGFLESR